MIAIHKELPSQKEPANKPYTSLRVKDKEVLLERKNRDIHGNLKVKVQQDELDRLFASTGLMKTALTGMNTSKIQKFIDKQKKRFAAKKTKEEASKQEKVMKVQQNLLNLHNFTLKERLKHSNKDGSLFTMKKSAGTNISNLKVGKRRNTSSTDEKRDPPRRFKISNLRIKDAAKKLAVDPDMDLLEQTLNVDSSRMDMDGSIINIYRRHSPSRRSSQGSQIRSDLKSSTSGDMTSPKRRSMGGGRHPPPLKMLNANISPGLTHELTVSSGSACLRRKQTKLSPDLRVVQEKPARTDTLQLESIDTGSKPTTEQFESIEPTRTAKQIKRSNIPQTEPQPSTEEPTMTFARKLKDLTAKYGQLGETEPQMLVRLHSAAIKIQFSVRKHLREKREARRPPRPHFVRPTEIQVKQQLSSENLKISSSRDGTGQSIRKGLIPALDLEKIGSQRNRSEPSGHLQVSNAKEEVEPPASTSRSIFARNTFRGFLDKLGVNNLEDLNIKSFPEMMNVREQAISHRHRSEETKIDALFKQRQISPRTYDVKRRELEVWATREREEVKRTKKHLEDEAQKTARIMKESAQNTEQIKRILKGVETQPAKSVTLTLTDRAV